MNLELFQRRAQIHLAGLHALIMDNVAPPGQRPESNRPTLLARYEALASAFDAVTDAALIPHTIFREPIASREDAERLFRYLHQNGLIFHPEDDPMDCIGDRITTDDARELRHRMAEAYQQEWSEYDCPCGFILSLEDEEQKSGFTATAMRQACALLTGLAASYEHPGYISITTTTHDFAIGDIDGDYR